MSNDTKTPIYYRAWIKPIEQWADELIMEFTSYGFPVRITAFMQDKHLIFEQDDLTIEQYTGLQDKNDKGIYGGDILLRENLTQKFLVVMVPATGAWTAIATKRPVNFVFGNEFKYCKVIGNIHQHPELLETVDNG